MAHNVIASLVMDESIALRSDVAARVRELGDDDLGELLTMLRNVRLFLTPEQPHADPTQAVDNPSFG